MKGPLRENCLHDNTGETRAEQNEVRTTSAIMMMMSPPPLLLPFLLLLLAQIHSSYCDDDSGADLLTFKLNNGFDIPLVGIGIGNLQHELIPQVVSANLMPSQDIHIRLIDTAHNSHNEHILGKAVASFDAANNHAQTRGGGSSVTHL